MAYRGRLIFPILAEIYRLDLEITNSLGGFDTVYREIKLVPSDDRLGASARVEMPPIMIPIQFEPSAVRKLHMMSSGDSSQGRVVGAMHFQSLEDMDLVSSTTGQALIKKGDRLGGLYRTDGALIETITNPPGAFVTDATPEAGLSGYRNLLLVTFESRDEGR